MIWHRCIYICIYIYIDICHEQVCLKVRQDTGVVEYYLRHSYVCHDSFMCDMMHSYVWHDSFICVTWLIHICDTSMGHARQLYIFLLILSHTGVFKGAPRRRRRWGVFDRCHYWISPQPQVEILQSQFPPKSTIWMTKELSFENFHVRLFDCCHYWISPQPQVDILKSQLPTKSTIWMTKELSFENFHVRLFDRRHCWISSQYDVEILNSQIPTKCTIWNHYRAVF